MLLVYFSNRNGAVASCPEVPAGSRAEVRAKGVAFPFLTCVTGLTGSFGEMACTVAPGSVPVISVCRLLGTRRQCGLVGILVRRVAAKGSASGTDCSTCRRNCFEVHPKMLHPWQVEQSVPAADLRRKPFEPECQPGRTDAASRAICEQKLPHRTPAPPCKPSHRKSRSTR